MSNPFSPFEFFGEFTDEQTRKELAEYIFYYLQNKYNKPIPMSNVNIENFGIAIDNILSNKTMQELCAKDPILAEQITLDILDFISKTYRHLRAIENPFEEEQAILNSFEQTNEDTFEKSWETTAPFVQKTYEQRIINTDFYYKKFQKSLTRSKKGKIDKNFEIVKKHFIGRWQGFLSQKKMKRELDIIDEERKVFCEELYKQIEELKKLQELLEPFEGELGRLWSMGKGRWQKVNFVILKEYAKLLEQDKSLQELAEMLGRLRQAEREYEEEIFAKDKIMEPSWKAEHASKAELVGIHESDDISSMLPAETALLANEATIPLFYKKFAEKKLQTFKYQAPETSLEKQKEKEETKGPFIICVDTSSSMHGTPATIAKTLCFAILKIAVRDNRKCYLISFSTNIKTINLTDLKNNLEELIKFLSMSFDGGTDATPAMEEALRMLETEDYKRADVIMVSDFIMSDFDKRVKNQIIAAREKKNKFHSLDIGDSGNKDVLKEFDNNWVYDPDNHDYVLKLVKDINGIYTTNNNIDGITSP